MLKRMDLFALKRLLLAAGALATLVIFFKSAGTMQAPIDLRSVIFLGWCLLPIGHLWTFGRPDDPTATRLILAAAAAMVVIFGLWVYVDMTVVHQDPKGTLAFIVVPFMQMGMAIPAILAAWIFRRRGGALTSTG